MTFIMSLIFGFFTTIFIGWLRPDIDVLSLAWWKYAIVLTFFIAIARVVG